ncbi:MAG TPA: hypothetical protein PLX14_14330, partial [Anaerolineales bacterium]|nr:hypothetical protein [Anaerolineales bacterium]
MTKQGLSRVLITTIFPAILLFVSAWVEALDNDSGFSMKADSSPSQSPTITSTGTTPTVTMTISRTPSSYPGIPTLYQPQDNAVLPQPVAPNEWVFTWAARNGPCEHRIFIIDPYQNIFYEHSEWNNYHYQTTQYIPDNALGPWYWRVDVLCPLRGNSSETRSFYVEAGPSGIPTWTLSATASSTSTFTPTPTTTPSMTSTLTATPTPACLTTPGRFEIIYP